MTIIDSQVHAYEANTPKRPWHSVPNWPDHVTGDEMVTAIDKVGVDGAIFISSFSMYRYDASYAVEVQRAHPGRFAIVKPVDPDDPAVADVVANWKNTPGTVAIRIMLTKEANREPNDPGFDRILRAAVRHDFPVNILCWGNVEAGTALIDRHPDTRFIVDHLGLMQPRMPPAPSQPWADLPKVLDLARRPNAVIKVSGACTLSREPYPFPDIWDPLARVFDAWGFDRCLWGTDWTRAFAVVNYEQAVEPFLQTDRLSDTERAMLMGGACAKAYNWSPDRGLPSRSGRERKGMEMSPDLARYLLWAGIIAIGTLLAILDRRWIGWPLFGVLMLAGVASGLIITTVSPFSFGGGDHLHGGRDRRLLGPIASSVGDPQRW
jgi:predicted TIM-barrel fold metal-dependent hydrolase